MRVSVDASHSEDDSRGLRVTYSLILLVLICRDIDSQAQNSLNVQLCCQLQSRQRETSKVVRLKMSDNHKSMGIEVSRHAALMDGVTYVCLEYLNEGLGTLSLHIIVPVLQ